jgi:uncharacterized protein YkwD
MNISFPKPPVEARLHRRLGFGFVLGLAACGGGGEPAGSAATAPSPPAAAASTPSSAAASTCGLSNFQASALAKVNQYRAAGATCGTLAPFPPAAALSWNALLTQAAEGHSQDMAAHDFFDHTAFDGRRFDQRITATSYQWRVVAENIAAGQTSIEQVMTEWMASEPHCANIMDSRLTEIGLVCVAATGKNFPTYWTMDLGKPL